MSDHGVVLPVRKKSQDPLCHRLGLRIVCQRADRYRQIENTDLLALPNDAQGQAVSGTAMHHYFIDQAAQERLLLIAREQALILDGGQTLPQCGKGIPKLGRDIIDAIGCLRRRIEIPLGLPELAQGLFPTALQFGRDQAIIRIDLKELPFGQRDLVTQALYLLGLCPCHSALCSGTRRNRFAISILPGA